MKNITEYRKLFVVAGFFVLGTELQAQNPHSPPADDNPYLSHAHRMESFPMCSNYKKANDLYPSYYSLPNPQDGELSQLNAYLSCVWRSQGSTSGSVASYYSRECSDTYGCVAIREYPVESSGAGSLDRPLTISEHRPKPDGPVYATDIPLFWFGSQFGFYQRCGMAVYQLNLARSQNGLPSLCESIPVDPVKLFCPKTKVVSNVIHPCDQDKASVDRYYRQMVLDIGERMRTKHLR